MVMFRLTFWPGKSAGPCLPGATRLRGKSYQSLISYPNVFSIFNQQLINLYQFSKINQQLINQLLINLLFASLQVSKLVLILFTVPPGLPLYLQPCVFPQLGVVLKINEIIMNSPNPKNH